MRAVIICNGEWADKSTLLPHINNADMVICADGGYNHIMDLGITPHAVIGDMDSILKLPTDTMLLRHSTEKDCTDTELALIYAMEKGADEIHFLCATGGRLDHTLCNIMLLELTGDKGRIITENGFIMLITSSAELSLPVGTTLSLIPMAGTAYGVETVGLKYPLKNEDLFFGAARGVSNVTTQEKCQVKIKSGRLMIMSISH